MSNAYDVRPAGSLKLKSTVNDGGIVKKSVNISRFILKTNNLVRERERVKELLLQDDLDPSSPGGSSRNSPAAGNGKPVKTEAERRFEEVQKQRLAQRVAKLANKTHKDRVNEFNSHLESLSEHHDIPKVRIFFLVWGFPCSDIFATGRTRIRCCVSVWRYWLAVTAPDRERVGSLCPSMLHQTIINYSCLCIPIDL
ncbi:hypothetical protein F5876DRAFT_46306 [Lentinula aff. lateritia]|uniref:Uncharacterized protein n=1 Tax=Lentinula aff. lateritia TaxID=2804960 RepID=A0ACC1TU89_9AGAR|nr:hypothetical protein F5876DRAFT_46306 [Lentinula aff. lateritia]